MPGNEATFLDTLDHLQAIVEYTCIYKPVVMGRHTCQPGRL